MRRLESHVALVTGAGGMIGRAIALRLAEEGARVACVDLSRAAVDESARVVQEAGGEAFGYVADVTDEPQCQAMVDAAIDRFGALHVVCNNAGISGPAQPIEHLDLAEWESLMAVNLRGVFLGCKYGLPAIRRSGGGSIVNLASSVASWDTPTDAVGYVASKAGVAAMTRSVALEGARYRVRANAVCPGLVRTRLGNDPAATWDEIDPWYRAKAARIPLRRVGEPEDVAAAVAFFASDDARHITGSLLLIDGGQTIQSFCNGPEREYSQLT